MPEDDVVSPVFEVLFEHCAAITASLELKDVVSSTLDAAGKLLNSDQIVLTLVEDDQIKVLASDPPVSVEIMETALAVGRGLVGRAVAARTPIYSPDVTTDPRVQETRGRWDTRDRSVVAVPLALGDQMIGALHAISREVDAFSEQDRARMVALAPAVATAMRNALVLQRERESWNHRRRLDEQKSAFMKLAARGLEEPLAEVETLVRQLQRGSPEVDPGEIADQLLDRSRYLAQQIEDILDLSMRESTEIVLPAD